MIAVSFTDVFSSMFQSGWTIGSFALGFVAGLGTTFLVLMIFIRLGVWVISLGSPLVKPPAGDQ